MDYKEIAIKLWSLLDDIDTASDMFKPSTVKSYGNFYKYAMRKSEERHKYLKSDGYDLYLPEEFKNLPINKKVSPLMKNKSCDVEKTDV